MTSFGYLLDTHGGPYRQPEPGPVESADFADQLVREAEEAVRPGAPELPPAERTSRDQNPSTSLPQASTSLPSASIFTSASAFLLWQARRR